MLCIFKYVLILENVVLFFGGSCTSTQYMCSINGFAFPDIFNVCQARLGYFLDSEHSIVKYSQERLDYSGQKIRVLFSLVSLGLFCWTEIKKLRDYKGSQWKKRLVC
eukprot:TRINITY_DN4939_c0_g1_i2.p4 TRINITY_DN4939_c0_g1~~TRINITY_DN4939_c0_g1_i2.p4  ORF type:complete len:107 (-),score=0.73 TRINITY_DN4939_c0_g1_i2:286-606(-)